MWKGQAQGENCLKFTVPSPPCECETEGAVVHPYRFLFVWSHCVLMGTMLAEVLVTQYWSPTLSPSSFHQNVYLGTISLACNDMSPEQTATNVNCSSPERHTRSYDYMEGGDIRVRRLFCRTQWYLRIDKRGKVKGTQEMKNSYNIMEIRTVAVGIVAIKGVESEYYLAMNKEGKLYAKKECNEDCNFKELILENHYNTYASAKWTHSGGEMFVALNQKGLPVKGKKTKKEQKTAHFLPMAIT
ncbi:keratinocyte growth factor-like protein [Cricetulus griseus]|uniref:Fibroblast growth factor n=1 Tax=Cricetulus griseus TaxID=10029 RepID=A0A061I1H6_CRIGR|nr:keratinocyte growth factor-like protein [Cricetulus griseus]